MLTAKRNAAWCDPGPSWQELQGEGPETDLAPPNVWQRLVARQRHLKWAMILWISWLPFTLIVFLVGRNVVPLMGGEVGTWVEPGLFGLCVIYAILVQIHRFIAWHRLRGWSCPECGRAFFGDSSFTPWPRSTACADCGAGLPPRYR